MPGFLVLYAIKEKTILEDINIKLRSFSDLQKNRIIYDNLFIERFTNKKFMKDKVFFEDDNIIICNEGIILNFAELSNRFATKNYFDLIKKLYIKYNNQFFTQFKGEFSGILYDKIEKKVILYTNRTSSKPLYYFVSNDYFIAASELKVVTKMLSILGIKYSLDEIGANFLITYGSTFEDFTLIQEIKKLKPGHYINIEKNNVSIEKYHIFSNEPILSIEKKKIINNLDQLFINAVKLEYNKDLEYQYKHITTLSGGLDSRMNVMTANELGYNNILNITFSQNDYLDERIAKKISSDLQNDFLFYSLNNGNYLMNIKDPVICNDTLVYYSGSAHMLDCIKKIDFREYGLLHTGMLGDAVLGSYLNGMNKKQGKVPLSKTAWNYDNLTLSTLNRLDKYYKEYESDELFKLYNRGFNGIFNGYWTINQFTEFGSPFLNVDFLSYALRIPINYRFKGKIYIEWIIRKHPRYAKYIHEKSVAKPSVKLFHLNYLRFMFKWVITKKLGKYMPLSMNPTEYWYRTNKNLKEFIQSYFYENIHSLDKYPELMNNGKTIFDNGNLMRKTQILTLLEAMKLYFNDK